MYIIDENICPQNHACPLIATCPAEAIAQLSTQSLPIIDNDVCIDCGVCEANCPMGAVIKTE